MDQGLSADYLSGTQGILSSPQLFQNHSRYDQRQVWLSRVTRQAF